MRSESYVHRLGWFPGVARLSTLAVPKITGIRCLWDAVMNSIPHLFNWLITLNASGFTNIYALFTNRTFQSQKLNDACSSIFRFAAELENGPPAKATDCPNRGEVR